MGAAGALSGQSAADRGGFPPAVPGRLGIVPALRHHPRMAYWQLHPLNARHGLTRILPELRAAANDAVAQVAAVTALPDFDLVVRAQSGAGMSDWGVAGRAPAPGVIEVTLDPARWTPAALIRTLVHDMHHLIRWEGPGYGRSLGEALVSEGLAGHFVTQVLGGAPDPWDAAAPGNGTARRALTEWARPHYDRSEWFMGRGKLRRWTGYGLGNRLIAAHLGPRADESALTLAHAPADLFRPALRALAGGEPDAASDGASLDDAAPDGGAPDDSPPADGSLDDGSPEGPTAVAEPPAES